MTTKNPFVTINTCTQTPLLADQTVLQCPALNRINLILNTFNSKINDNIENHSTSIRQIHSIFSDDYTKSKLLNDFHHIKYYHHVDENNHQFDTVFQYLAKHTTCHIQCHYIQRHYIDRTTLFKEYHALNDGDVDKLNVLQQQILQLIARIHVYFIHSYDMNNRLTVQQKDLIEQKLRDFDSKEVDLENKKIEITLAIINQNPNQATTQNNQKFIEHVSGFFQSEDNKLDFEKMHQKLQENNIDITQHKLNSAFSAYSNQDIFISDLIDVYYDMNDKSLAHSILIQHLSSSHDNRYKIYQTILFKYVQSHQLNNVNFIKITKKIIASKNDKSDTKIDIDEFVKNAMHHKINGKIFLKGKPTFKNSLKFAKMFNKIPGYKKKKFTKIYALIKQWNPIDLAPTIVPATHLHQENALNTQAINIYENSSSPEAKEINTEPELEKQTDIYIFLWNQILFLGFYETSSTLHQKTIYTFERRNVT
eukprot:340836_1